MMNDELNSVSSSEDPVLIRDEDKNLVLLGKSFSQIDADSFAEFR